MMRNPKAMMAALAGGLIASAIGYGLYKFTGSGDLSFMRWTAEGPLATVWLIVGIAVGYVSGVKFGPTGRN